MDDSYDLPIGLFVGATLTFIIFLIFSSSSGLSDDTLLNICNELGDTTDIEYNPIVRKGNLICEFPSYNNTKNIIFRPNGGGS